MPASVLQFTPRQASATPDPDTPVVARWLTRHGWTALDAFHAGLDLEVCAAILTAEMAAT